MIVEVDEESEVKKRQMNRKPIKMIVVDLRKANEFSFSTLGIQDEGRNLYMVKSSDFAEPDVFERSLLSRESALSDKINDRKV